MTARIYSTDAPEIRQGLIDSGLLRSGTDVRLTRTVPSSGPVLRLDALGRAVAARRIARGGIDTSGFDNDIPGVTTRRRR